MRYDKAENRVFIYIATGGEDVPRVAVEYVRRVWRSLKELTAHVVTLPHKLKRLSDGDSTMQSVVLHLDFEVLRFTFRRRGGWLLFRWMGFREDHPWKEVRACFDRLVEEAWGISRRLDDDGNGRRLTNKDWMELDMALAVASNAVDLLLIRNSEDEALPSSLRAWFPAYDKYYLRKAIFFLIEARTLSWAAMTPDLRQLFTADLDIVRLQTEKIGMDRFPQVNGEWVERLVRALEYYNSLHLDYQSVMDSVDIQKWFIPCRDFPVHCEMKVLRRLFKNGVTDPQNSPAFSYIGTSKLLSLPSLQRSDGSRLFYQGSQRQGVLAIGFPS